MRKTAYFAPLSLLLIGGCLGAATLRRPTFVFEGTDWPGNSGSLEAMKRASTNPSVHFLPVRGADHFSILAPTIRLIASKILADTGPATNIDFTEAELSKLLP
jgi:hypothetical protein